MIPHNPIRMIKFLASLDYPLTKEKICEETFEQDHPKQSSYSQ